MQARTEQRKRKSNRHDSSSASSSRDKNSQQRTQNESSKRQNAQTRLRQQKDQAQAQRNLLQEQQRLQQPLLRGHTQEASLVSQMPNLDRLLPREGVQKPTNTLPRNSDAGNQRSPSQSNQQSPQRLQRAQASQRSKQSPQHPASPTRQDHRPLFVDLSQQHQGHRPVFVDPKNQPEHVTHEQTSESITAGAFSLKPRGLVANLPCPWGNQQAQDNNIETGFAPTSLAANCLGDSMSRNRNEDNPPAEPCDPFLAGMTTDNLQLIKDGKLESFDKEFEKLKLQWAVDSLKQETFSSYSNALQSLDTVVGQLDSSLETSLITPTPPWITREKKRRRRNALHRTLGVKREKYTWDWTKEDIFLPNLFETKKKTKKKNIKLAEIYDACDQTCMNNFYDTPDDLEMSVRSSQSQEDNTKQSTSPGAIICDRFGVETICQAEDFVHNDREASKTTLASEQLTFHLHEKIIETVQRYRTLNITPYGLNTSYGMEGDCTRKECVTLCTEAQTDPHFGCDNCGKSFRPEEDIADFSMACQTELCTTQAGAQTDPPPIGISIKTQTKSKTQTVPCQTSCIITVQRCSQTNKMTSVHRKTQTVIDHVSLGLQIEPEHATAEAQTHEVRVNGIDKDTQTSVLYRAEDCHRLECIMKASEEPATTEQIHPPSRKPYMDAKDIVLRTLPCILLMIVAGVFGPIAFTLFSITYILLSLASLRRVLNSCCRLPEVADRIEILYPAGEEDVEEQAEAGPCPPQPEAQRSLPARIVMVMANWYLQVAGRAYVVYKTLTNMSEDNQYTMVPWSPSIPAMDCIPEKDPCALLRQFCHHRGIEVELNMSGDCPSCMLSAPTWLADLGAVGARNERTLSKHIFQELLEAMGLQNTTDTSFLQHPDSRYMLYWLARARGDGKKLYMAVTKHDAQLEENTDSHFSVTLWYGRVQQSACGPEPSPEAVALAEEKAAALLFHKLMFTWLRLSYKKKDHVEKYSADQGSGDPKQNAQTQGTYKGQGASVNPGTNQVRDINQISNKNANGKAQFSNQSVHQSRDRPSVTNPPAMNKLIHQSTFPLNVNQTKVTTSTLTPDISPIIHQAKDTTVTVPLITHANALTPDVSPILNPTKDTTLTVPLIKQAKEKTLLTNQFMNQAQQNKAPSLSPNPQQAQNKVSTMTLNLSQTKDVPSTNVSQTTAKVLTTSPSRHTKNASTKSPRKNQGKAAAMSPRAQQAKEKQQIGSQTKGKQQQMSASASPAKDKVQSNNQSVGQSNNKPPLMNHSGNQSKGKGMGGNEPKTKQSPQPTNQSKKSWRL